MKKIIYTILCILIINISSHTTAASEIIKTPLLEDLEISKGSIADQYMIGKDSYYYEQIKPASETFPGEENDWDNGLGLGEKLPIGDSFGILLLASIIYMTGKIIIKNKKLDKIKKN